MKSIFSLLLLLGSSCVSQNLGGHVVKGMVYDSESLEPISNVQVQVKIFQPFLQEVVQTDSKGEFQIEYDGDFVLLPDLFLEQEDLQTKERNIKVKLIHPEFLSDSYEENKSCKPEELSEFDIGTFYLQRREEFSLKK